MDHDDSAPEQKASLPGAVAIVIGNMIGVGVFASLGFQVADLPSGFAILMVWLAGGVVAFCGAVCYAELVSMFPRSGGEYHLLRSAYHPFPGFLAGWVSIVAGFPAPVALASSAFGSYFASSMFPAANATILAVLLVLAITGVHLVHIAFSSRFQSVATVFKVLLLGMLIAAGFAVDQPTEIRFVPASSDEWRLLGSASFGYALMWVLYSYEGWNGAAYIAGEVRNPQRNIPLALLLGTLTVTLLYVGINAAFLYAAPIDAMVGQKEVGLVAAGHIFGEQGGRIMGGLISAGLISAVSAMTWAGPRVSASVGEDYPRLRILAQRNKGGVPVAATLVQAALAIIVILTANFEQILMYVEVLLLLSSTATVTAVVYLRIRQPKRERPYRAFGYPLTPLLFVAVTSFALFFAFDRHGKESFAGLTVLVAGAVLYWSCRTHPKNGK